MESTNKSGRTTGAGAWLTPLTLSCYDAVDQLVRVCYDAVDQLVRVMSKKHKQCFRFTSERWIWLEFSANLTFFATTRPRICIYQNFTARTWQ